MSPVAEMEITGLDEYALIASVCRASLWDFVQEFWGEITEEPLIPNWHMPFLCRQLEYLAERVINRQKKEHDLLINIAPGTSKSTICSVMFPAWIWTRAPWVQIICGSFAEPLSLDLAGKSRDIITSEKYQKAFGIRMRPDQYTKSYFMNTSGGWRFSAGVGGSATGKHGHIILIDDPVDPRMAYSPADLKAANDWLTNVITKRKVSHDTTVSVMIMQRLGEDDPSALWLSWRDKGMPLKHVCLPAELTKNVRPARLAQMYENGLFDPKRFSKEVLKQERLKGEWTYQSQFLQAPVPPGGGLFKTGKLLIEPIDYSVGLWQLVRYWDKACTPEGGAYTVGALLGKAPDGVFWVLDIVRGQWEPSERERIIKQTGTMDGKRIPIIVEEEPGSGGKESAQATIRMMAGWRIRADRPTGNKFVRADPYAAQVNGGNVKLRKGEWNKDYIGELRGFSLQATYKDQVDASSGAFAYLSGRKIKLGAL